MTSQKGRYPGSLTCRAVVLGPALQPGFHTLRSRQTDSKRHGLFRHVSSAELKMVKISSSNAKKKPYKK